MKKFRTLLMLSLMPVCAFAAAHADSLSISLTPALETGSSGETLTFDATITNESGSTVYLNADSFFVDSPLTVDDSPFYSTPFDLTSGDSWSGALFNIDIPAGTPASLYAGYFDILGGGPGDDTTLAGQADFNVVVTPEPASVLLVSTGLAALARVAFARRRESNSGQIPDL